MTLYEGIPQQGPTLGSASAPITLTDYSDLQCPYCRNFAVRVLPTLVTRFVRTGHLRIVFSNLPILGPDSQRAARFALAAGLQDRMWPFVDLFMNNQQREGSGYVTDAFLRGLAGQVPGLDVERAFSAMDSADVEVRLAEVKQQARARNVHGTPTFFLGRTGETPSLLEAGSSNTDAFVEAIARMLGGA